MFFFFFFPLTFAEATKGGMTSVIPFYVCEVGKPRGNPYTRRLVFKYGVVIIIK